MLIYAKEPRAQALVKAHQLDAGFDLSSQDTVCIQENSCFLFDTGIHIKLEPSEVGLILPRSSTAKYGLLVVTGVIDAGYTGSLKIQIINPFAKKITVTKGQRLAQLVVVNNSRIGQSAYAVSLDTFENLSEGISDNRKSCGFGSSGK